MSSSRESLHIDAPELLSRARRFRDAFVTGFMWALYTYLWAPLVSLMAWLLGFEFAYNVMVRAGGLESLKQVLFWYGIMLSGIIVVVTGWSLINRLRFAREERRHAAAIVDDSAIAEAFGIEHEQLDILRTVRVARLILDEHGVIERIETPGKSQRVPDRQNEASQKKKATIRAG